jgi:hypothetical protein
MKDNPMKNLSLIILIAGLGAGCGKQENAEAGKPKSAEPKPNPPAVGPQELIASPIVENSIRQQLKKPKGELTQADLEKVTELDLFDTKITDAGLKEVAKLQQLTSLDLEETQVTYAGLEKMQKALPKCKIYH